jgi:hypothetical protein
VLVNESFNGLKYEYSFPCPDCVENRAVDPCLFSSSLLRRANELKAPFLQCHKFFHTISIKEMLATMPIEGASTLDLHLQYSLRDLAHLKTNFKYDVLFWYCEQDQTVSAIKPSTLVEAIRKEGYKVWYSTKPKEVKIENIALLIKESKMVILCMSDSFSQDEKCIEVFELVKNIIRKNYLLVELGSFGSHKWLENHLFVSVCSDFRIIMQDKNRYAVKLVEMLEILERQLQIKETGQIKKSSSVDDDNDTPADVFISYCWANSNEAVKKGTKPTRDHKGNVTSIGWLDPRTLLQYFKVISSHLFLTIEEPNQMKTNML